MWRDCRNIAACDLNYAHDLTRTDYMAFFTGAACRLHRVDRYARGSVSRTAGFLHQPLENLPHDLAAQVLLPFYLRILLQPLCHGTDAADHALPAAFPGLAGLPYRRLRAGMDRKRLHEPFPADPRGDEKGKNGCRPARAGAEGNA